MIVTKFGGTSVGDAEAIRRLLRIVGARLLEQPVVVVSALAGVTDQLLRLATMTAHGDGDAVRDGVFALATRHREVADSLGLDEAAIAPVLEEIAQVGVIVAGRAGRTATPEELDWLAGHGERWSSAMVVAAGTAAGLPTVLVDVRSVMRTDTRFTRAAPDRAALAQAAPRVFGPLLDQGQVPVTQGFLGRAPDDRPTTLGRGGSDFTATLLGAALGATRVEIWTDVDGLMTADPRVVPHARCLTVATYEEAAELATFGAKVLHPATQLPLAEAGIPIHILNSRRPEGPGTRIVADVDIDLASGPVRSISWKRGITVITVQAPRMLGAYGFLRRLFEIFERHEVVVDVLASSEVSVSLTIEEEEALETLRPELEALGRVDIVTGRAIVAVVGIGLRTTPGIAARLFGAISDTNVEVISQGSSAINVTFVVREEEARGVVRRLHDAFIGTEG